MSRAHVSQFSILNSPFLVAESYANATSCPHQVAMWPHGLEMPTGLFKRHRNNILGTQRNHLAGDAIVERHHRRSAIARGQNAIVGAWRAAALEMAQHHAAAILAGDLAELLSDGKANTAETARCHVEC